MKKNKLERLKVKGSVDNSVQGTIQRVQHLRTLEQTEAVKEEISKLIKSVIHKPKCNE